ncbi:flagellar hook protein FlgE [Massilia sp. WF1]|uniref:flagellar hook protein FlgE n=1 Tax=unclassified Massilia TaxID=2609279 RepID=UPI00064B7E24|nr:MULTISPECIES: flagellar hook-basal body complex protein [unclassified Massilia]ALK96037.1 flagellar biosynthesis protein FlgE [Massilia sp. WG5]KLU37381.1 flagellar hook protein FlgE [Massilia sp. WF1]
MSFDIALSGIQAINQSLEATSNNIANAATYGFKSSRANFSSVYAGTQANGVEVGSLTQTIGQNGSTQTTGRGLDAAIDGRGFFVGRDSTGSLTYSRVGIFSTDTKGFLIDSNGKKVQGYGPSKGGALGPMGDIQVPTGQIDASPTTSIAFVGNLSADWTPPATGTFNAADSTSYNMVKQSVVYDSLGTQHTVSQYFVKADDTSVTVHYKFDDNAVEATTDTLKFDAKGQLVAGTTPMALTLTPKGGAAPIAFSIDYTGTTKFAGEATTTTNRSDGYASGAFVGVELAKDGSLVAKYSNDQSQVVGTVAIATFANEGALQAISDTSWSANADSGAALYNVPGVGLSGKLTTGALEGSNVDITSELVGLMTSQRNYQANSKVLTTENQMMQSLMQAL